MRDLKLALVQRATAWHDPAGNREALQATLATLPVGLDVVLLPEMFTTGFTMAMPEQGEPHPGPTVSWLTAQARSLGAAVAGSVAVLDAGDAARNRFYFATPDGEVTFYDKRHLFRMADEHHHYTAGAARVVVPWRGWRLALQVCYDLRFPVWSRNRDEYDLLLYVANWPERRVSAWSRLLVARAIENQAYVAGVNRIGEDGNGIYHSGHSALIDPMGEVLWEVSHSEACYTITLKADSLLQVREKLPFLNDRDSFTIHE